MRTLALHTLVPVFALMVGVLLASTAQAACDSGWRRVVHGDSTCMHAWWNNDYLGGANHGFDVAVRSYCSDYGTVVAKIDTIDGRDRTWHLNDGETRRETGMAVKTRNVYCCWDISDLCFKNEVEADSNGRIKLLVGSVVSSPSVATHVDRYELCQEHPDSVYCENDPEGDAFVEPVSDETCLAEWNSNRANRSCRDTVITVDNSDSANPSCSINTSCRQGNYTDWTVNDLTVPLSDVSNLNNCDGELTIESC